MTGYELSRSWFDFCFENPEKVKPIHSAIYFFAIEHCNRLGWKEKFGFPTKMTMDAIGIKKYNTYILALRDLEEWCFVKMIEKSKNQYSANIIAIYQNGKALVCASHQQYKADGVASYQKYTALDNAVLNNKNKGYHNHIKEICYAEKGESTVQSTVQSKVTIDKQLNTEPLTIINNLKGIILSLNSEIKNQKNGNEKTNQPFGENKLSGTELLVRTTEPRRDYSEFIGQISLEGKVIR